MQVMYVDVYWLIILSTFSNKWTINDLWRITHHRVVLILSHLYEPLGSQQQQAINLVCREWGRIIDVRLQVDRQASLYGWQLVGSKMLYIPGVIITTEKRSIVIHKVDLCESAKFWQSPTDSNWHKHATGIVCAINGHLWCTIDSVTSCLSSNVSLSYFW